MKRIVILLMAFVMTVTLVGCSTGKSNEEIIKKGVELYLSAPNETVLKAYDEAIEEAKKTMGEEATLATAPVDFKIAYQDFNEYYTESGIQYIAQKTDYVSYQYAIRESGKTFSEMDIAVQKKDDMNYDVKVTINYNGKERKYNGRAQIKEGKITYFRMYSFSASDFDE